MNTRRAFLQQTLLAPLVLAGCQRQGTVAGGPSLGLFFTAADLPRLRHLYSTLPLFAALRAEMAAIDRVAERRFLADEVRYNDHLFDINRIGKLAPRMAFLYAMTGDDDAGQLAVEGVEALMRFPKWDYFLEGGTDIIGLQRAPSSTVAVALCADWLGDAVPPAQRRSWLAAMGERGCAPCYRSLYGMRHPERVVGWGFDETSTYFEHRPDGRVDLSNWPRILDRTNLKAVPAAALALATVAYRQVIGQDAASDRWLEQAAFSLGTFGDLFTPDGSYDEGVSYANYTALHLAQGMTALARHEGLDLRDRINWRGFIDYAAALTMPTAEDPHAIVNFGDAGEGMLSGVPFWVASRYGAGQAQWFGEALARGHDLWSVLWYDPDVAPTPPPPGPHRWRSDLDWAVARTGYGADDLVVAFRSGGPANHEHADRNSLIVKAHGEVLVADPYRPPYSAADPAWMLRTTLGHSALLIDGQGHQYHDGAEGTNPSDAHAHLIADAHHPDHFAWTSDATPAYQMVLPDVRRVLRSVFILPDLYAVIVLDQVEKATTPSLLEARYFADNGDGQARIIATEDHFTTHRPQAQLHAFAVGSSSVTTASAVLPVPSEVARQHPYAAVRTRTPSLTPILCTLLLPRVQGTPLPTARLTLEPDQQIHFALTHRDQPHTGRILLTSPTPILIR